MSSNGSRRAGAPKWGQTAIASHLGPGTVRTLTVPSCRASPWDRSAMGRRPLLAAVCTSAVATGCGSDREPSSIATTGPAGPARLEQWVALSRHDREALRARVVGAFVVPAHGPDSDRTVRVELRLSNRGESRVLLSPLAAVRLVTERRVRRPLDHGSRRCRTPRRLVLTAGERRLLCFVFRARSGARPRALHMTVGKEFSPATAVWDLTALER